MGPRIVEAGATTFREIFGEIANPDRALSAAGLNDLLHSALSTIALAVAPVAGACLLASLVTGVAQVGFKPSAKGLKPDFRRINPASGLRNLLGPNTVFEAFKVIAKVGIVSAVAALALLPGLTTLSARVGIPASALGSLMGKNALSIAQHIAFAYVIVGLVDYAWKRRSHERMLRMTKQEVKDETRQYGVSAGGRRNALRRRQMAAAPACADGLRPQSGRGRDQPDALRRGLGLRRFAYRT